MKCLTLEFLTLLEFSQSPQRERESERERERERERGREFVRVWNNFILIARCNIMLRMKSAI